MFKKLRDQRSVRNLRHLGKLRNLRNLTNLKNSKSFRHSFAKLVEENDEGKTKFYDFLKFL